MFEWADSAELIDKSLICPSPVGSRGLKGFHREPTAFWCVGPGFAVGSAGMYQWPGGLLCWRVFEVAAEEVLGGLGVAGCGVVADAED